MCRAYPGPRCPKHAKEYLAKAENKLQSLVDSGAPEEEIMKAQAVVEANKARYRNTTEFEANARDRAAKLEQKAVSEYSSDPDKFNLTMTQAAHLKAQADACRDARLASRREIRVHKAPEAEGIRGIDTYQTVLSMIEAKRLVAEGKGDQVIRGRNGNMASASKVAADYDRFRETYGDEFDDLVRATKKNGLRHIAEPDAVDMSYARGMEPRFREVGHKPPESRIVRMTDGTVVRGTPKIKERETRVKVFAGNGVATEAVLRVGVMQAEDGTWHTYLAANGSSSLYGNAAAQDAMSDQRGSSLMATDAPKWRKNASMGTFRTRKDAEAGLARFIDEANISDEKTGRYSSGIGSVISSMGTKRLNTRLHEGKSIVHSSLDEGKNSLQTSGASFRLGERLQDDLQIKARRAFLRKKREG